MNYLTIQNVLVADGYDAVRVSSFNAYLKESAKDVVKNPWVRTLGENEAAELFKKVALDGVFIDGEEVTIQSRKNKMIVSYGYQAYKNRMLFVYPESKIDLQLVMEGDEFSFEKKSGSVEYSHTLKNPFEKNQKIIGGYCVIKNSRGEFLTTLNMEEIGKMRAVANTQSIWNVWEGEMIKKSLIKRACKTHFNDAFIAIEKMDNEQYDLDASGVDYLIISEIEEADTKEALDAIYKNHLPAVKEAQREPEFLRMLSKRKLELKNQPA